MNAAVITKAWQWAKDNRYLIGVILTAIGGILCEKVNAITAGLAVMAALSRSKGTASEQGTANMPAANTPISLDAKVFKFPSNGDGQHS